jgi:hypothetical protein
MNRENAERVYFEQLKRTVSIEAVLARYGRRDHADLHRGQPARRTERPHAAPGHRH